MLYPQSVTKAAALRDAIFDGADCSLIATDAQGVIQVFNPGAQRMLGYTAAEVVNQLDIADLHDSRAVAVRGRAAANPVVPELDLSAAPSGDPIMYIRKDGSRLPVAESVTTLHDDAGSVIGYLRVGTDVSQRPLPERALCESEAFSCKIVKSSSDWITVLDLDGTVLGIPSGRELLGVEDIHSFPSRVWLDLWEGEDREGAGVAMAAAAAGDTGNFVGYFQTLRGEPKWWDVAVTPILDINGRPGQLLAVARDVTQRRQAELEFFEFLASVSQDLMRWTSVDEMMQTIGAKMGSYFQLALCAFAEIDEATDSATVKHEWHRDDMPSVVGVYRIADFVGQEFTRAARAGEVIVVRDVNTDARVDPAQFAVLNIGSFICAPFIRDGQWRFSLNLYRSVGCEWREQEIELARELSARIWTRLERLRAEAALRESEERARQALDSSELGTWNIDPVTGLFSSDARFKVIFGISVEGLNEQQALANIHPADYPCIQAAVDAAMRPHDPAPYEVEYRVIHADGSLHWVLAQGRADFEGMGAERRLLSFAGTVADITARKQAEEVLHQRTAQFETLVGAK